MNIEDTIFDDGMAVNTLAALKSFENCLRDAHTNCADSLSGAHKVRARKILWFLNAQVHGQTVTIDMMSEWEALQQVQEETA